MPTDLQLDFVIATFYQSEWHRCVSSWRETASRDHIVIIVPKMDIMSAFQEGFARSRADVLAFIHDDVLIYEQGWDQRVLVEFSDPSVGLVGFGGAPGFCHPNLRPDNYSPGAMGRIGFRSNMRNWQVHGGHLIGAENATIVDGFAIFIRRKVLERAGGWPVGTPVSYFCYDFWACCITRELGYKIRLVGVDCEHLGGRSTGLNPDLKPNWEEAHRWTYERFQKILPAWTEP